MADDPQYIALDLLKKRLVGNQTTTPEQDDDFTRLIESASATVRDHCVPFDETNPPARVQQVTLMVAMRLRQAETNNYTDKEGRPIQVRVWTVDLENILGVLLATDAPEDPIHTPIAGDLAVPSEHAIGAAVQARRGRRRPWGLP
jgi:hypothetical protein